MLRVNNSRTVWCETPTGTWERFEVGEAEHPQMGPYLRAKLVSPAPAEGEKCEWAVIGVYPDRLPFLLATVDLEDVSSRDRLLVQGFNAQGVTTLRFEPLQLRRGMLMANRTGFVSGEIRAIGMPGEEVPCPDARRDAPAPTPTPAPAAGQSLENKIRQILFAKDAVWSAATCAEIAKLVK
jgi:hypothetical protein